MIEPGQAAPDFTLPDQDGNPVALAQLRGKTVVLYFYPKADTPGCTRQACGVRDHASDYDAAGAVVLGVSRDSVARLRSFADKHGLAIVEDAGLTPAATLHREHLGIQHAKRISRRLQETAPVRVVAGGLRGVGAAAFYGAARRIPWRTHRPHSSCSRT